MMRIFLFTEGGMNTLESFVKSRESTEHGCLTPVQRRSFVDQPAGITPVVEMTVPILHPLDSPLRDSKGQIKALLIAIVEEDQRYRSPVNNIECQSAAFCNRNNAAFRPREKNVVFQYSYPDVRFISNRRSPVLSA